MRFWEEDHWDGSPTLKLLCPVCGHDYNHHGEVARYIRIPSEDGPTFRVANGMTLPTKFNPSPRRGAIEIEIEGECHHHWRLQIIQHKGWTFCQADFDPKQPTAPQDES